VVRARRRHPVLLFAMPLTSTNGSSAGGHGTGHGGLVRIKAGIAIGGFMTLRLLAAFHYVPNQAQTPEAVAGIKLLFSVIPAVFSLVYGVILVLYPINEATLHRIEGELASRRAGPPKTP
jgi:GPH family glycoside/pentoside/hexuronide:cation symporter